MLSLLVLAVPAPDAVQAEATPRGLTFATVPNEPVVPERMTYTGGRWERLFGTPLPAAAPAMSCRHPTFVDGANPERMRSGSYCCDKSNGCSDASFASCTSWTSGGGGFTTSTAACPGCPAACPGTCPTWCQTCQTATTSGARGGGYCAKDCYFDICSPFVGWYGSTSSGIVAQREQLGVKPHHIATYDAVEAARDPPICQYGSQKWQLSDNDVSGTIRAMVEGRKGRLLDDCMRDCFNYDNRGTGDRFLADNGVVHPDGTGFKTEWCACSKPSPQSWNVMQSWIDGFNGYC